MDWLIARYQPVGLFSLKHGEATSTGGKSLLIPTPFAVRMALLDVAIRTEGVAIAAHSFERIKSLRLAIRPPDYAAVSGLFGKILKPERKKDTDRAMTPTIAFREYVHLWGELSLAFGGESPVQERIYPWLAQISYLGKRGGFVQLIEPPRQIATEDQESPHGFILLDGSELRNGGQLTQFPLGLVQRLDDWGPEMTLKKADVYHRSRKGKIRLGQDRVRLDVILPYQMVRAGRGFTLYERMAGS